MRVNISDIHLRRFCSNHGTEDCFYHSRKSPHLLLFKPSIICWLNSSNRPHPRNVKTMLMPFPLKAGDLFFYVFFGLDQVHAIKFLRWKTLNLQSLDMFVCEISVGYLALKLGISELQIYRLSYSLSVFEDHLNKGGLFECRKANDLPRQSTISLALLLRKAWRQPSKWVLQKLCQGLASTTRRSSGSWMRYIFRSEESHAMLYREPYCRRKLRLYLSCTNVDRHKQNIWWFFNALKGR